jgi:LysM repeat protein
MKRIVVMAAVFAAVTFSVATPHASAADSTKTITSKKSSVATAAKTEEKTTDAPAPVMVTVVAGDTLSAIAEAHQTTWVRIFNANEQIENPDLINPGDQLRIPSADEVLPDRTLPAAAPAPTPTATTTVKRASTTTTTASYPVDANSAKAYIYARESGNNPNATSPRGCYGLGQDCNGVVRIQCGADYACQDAYFTSYAMRRYGSWENALAFWQNHHWW